MKNKQGLSTDVELISTLRLLAEAYEEISVLKMQKVRNSVLTTRDFLDGLSSVFVDVKKNYQHQIRQLVEKKKIDPRVSFTTKQTNGKTLSVFLSANSKFYGDIITRVFGLFVKEIASNTSDVVIIGRTGKEMMDALERKYEYTYFELPDANISIDDLRPIIDTLVQYEKVDVYYGRFSNMINQLAAMTNVSGQQILDAGADLEELPEDGDESMYAFEPSIKEILYFFENQVFVSLFKQTVNEAELARLASRVRAMEEALGNIDRLSPSLHREERVLRKSEQHKKQLNALNGIMFLRNHRNQ
jgi:F0F1-type ATP synthase gamma subunit